MRAFASIVKLTFRHAVRSHIFQLLFGVLLLCVILIPTTVTFFRDSKRIEGTDIKISARNLGEEENDPKNPARKKRTPAPASDAGSFEDYYRGEGKSGNSGAKPAGTPQAPAGKKMSRQEADAILGLDEVPADAK